MTLRTVALVFVVFAACADPVNSAERTALGPEDPSVPPGELHRPGQPCLVCHDNFSVAGTVYNEDLVTPFEGATVTLTDASGSQWDATTNSAGNFFVRKSDWTPVFPIGTYTASDGTNVVGVSIVGADPNNTAQMITKIGRDGSCCACHRPDGPSTSSPGPIYVTTGAPP
jgi:hypothetical protein